MEIQNNSRKPEARKSEKERNLLLVLVECRPMGLELRLFWWACIIRGVEEGGGLSDVAYLLPAFRIHEKKKKTKDQDSDRARKGEIKELSGIDY